MSDTFQEFRGQRVLICTGAEPKIATERAANNVLGAALGEDAAMVAIDVTRLSDEFFRLGSGFAGTVIQKFANYRVRLAIVGDVSRWTQTSKPFHDFVYEANNGRQLWFVRDTAELEARMASA